MQGRLVAVVGDGSNDAPTPLTPRASAGNEHQRAGRPDPGFDAAIFDLDGVITFTARVHAASWKELFDEYLRSREKRVGEPFRPFTDADYRAYVDGRPRYEGVRTFLASRGIALPDGDPSDPPDAETVCGLGNRKNLRFRELLQELGADVDREAVRFVRELRERGIRVGVASSSRNTELVLERAGLTSLFDARVDGLLSARLGLRGKPAPDIFLECLKRLGASDPQRAIVAEDAMAGVEAGRAGGFGCVLGVDRGGQAVALREHGADWIVRDFREVTPERVRVYLENRAHARPNALARWADVARELGGRTPAIFLDYDGTLTPIVARPDLAVISDDMRETLRRLATDRGKGQAVLWLLEALGLDRPDVVPLYVGDDVTDEDAFRALEACGIGILLAELPRPTAARYSLQDIVEVRELMERLAKIGRESPST